jgi:hypothetical protein
MRGRDAVRLVVVAACAGLTAAAVAGSRAAAAGVDVPAPAGVSTTSVPGPPVPASFRSVRTYREVAEPVRLRIPAAGVDTGLELLGRAADGSIEVPADFGAAGWFAEGPRPGEDGPAVVLGHVDSRTGPGVFVGLAGLAPGAEVLLDRGDGTTVTFRTSRTERVTKAEFPTELVYGATLEPSLRLVTCGGSFDRAAGSYRDNVIVYADLVR